VGVKANATRKRTESYGDGKTRQNDCEEQGKSARQFRERVRKNQIQGNTERRANANRSVNGEV
jgi:hypothetical protein